MFKQVNKLLLFEHSLRFLVTYKYFLYKRYAIKP